MRSVMVGSQSTSANSKTFEVSTPGEKDIRMTRLFSAPRKLVFEVMSKPEHVRRWWGILDEHHSVIVCEIDFKVGGKWRFQSKGPKGVIPAFYGEYKEISAPEKVVFTETFEPFPDAPSLVTCTLVEVENGKTHMTVVAEYVSQEVRDMVVSTGMATGAAISYDRLEDILTELQRS
jgi:uncharacterized protein YndB with AHSA1/START domain